MRRPLSFAVVRRPVRHFPGGLTKRPAQSVQVAQGLEFQRLQQDKFRRPRRPTRPITEPLNERDQQQRPGALNRKSPVSLLEQPTALNPPNPPKKNPRLHTGRDRSDGWSRCVGIGGHDPQNAHGQLTRYERRTNDALRTLVSGGLAGEPAKAHSLVRKAGHGWN